MRWPRTMRRGRARCLRPRRQWLSSAGGYDRRSSAAELSRAWRTCLSGAGNRRGSGRLAGCMILSGDQAAIGDAVRACAQERVRPRNAVFEAACGYPADPFVELAGLGLRGMTSREEKGGAGADHVSHALALIEIAAADGALSTVVSIQNSILVSGTFNVIAKFAARLSLAGPSGEGRKRRRIRGTGRPSGLQRVQGWHHGHDAAHRARPGAVRDTGDDDRSKHILDSHDGRDERGGSAVARPAGAVPEPPRQARGIRAACRGDHRQPHACGETIRRDGAIRMTPR